jgi:hypothetical protein
VRRPVPVFAELSAFRAAASGLPLRARLVDRVAGSIAVVDGATEWWDAAAAAIGAGASAVLVAEPRDVPLHAAGELAARSEVPILVQRSRLRGDLMATAVAHRDGVAPRLVVAECWGRLAERPVLVRDAVGWVRTLVGGRLGLGSASVTAEGGTALLRAEGTGLLASLVITGTRVDGAGLRVRALGETITEIELDEAIGRTELTTSTSRGRLVAPSMFESPEREALRRAVDAVGAAVDAAPFAHLDDLLHDARLAASVLG